MRRIFGGALGSLLLLGSVHWGVPAAHAEKDVPVFADALANGAPSPRGDAAPSDAGFPFEGGSPSDTGSLVDTGVPLDSSSFSGTRDAAAGEAVAAIDTRTKGLPTHVLEGDLYVGLNIMVAPAVDHRGEIDSTNGGFGVAFGLTYRTRYFLSPFLEFGYASIYRNEKNVDLGSAGGTAVSSGRLSAMSVLVGPALDLWRFRLRAGIGLYRLSTTTRVLGTSVSSDELDMGYGFSLSGYPLRTDRFQLGLEARLHLILEGGTTVFSIGPTFTGDIFRW